MRSEKEVEAGERRTETGRKTRRKGGGGGGGRGGRGSGEGERGGNLGRPLLVSSSAPAHAHRKIAPYPPSVPVMPSQAGRQIAKLV
eukprot:1677045-Rhodomonas_salina.2